MKTGKIIKKIVILIVIAIAAFFGYKYFFTQEVAESGTVEFKTDVVSRGDVRRTISATGTVEPEELINVGAQVNGKIMSFGTDADGNTVDYGSRVSAGMILAQIDDVTYKAELQESEAQLQQANASIQSAEAAISEAQANETLANNNWERAQMLFKQGSMTRSDYESYQTSFFTARAASAKAQAQLAQAHAQKSIAEASLVRARRNLEYCTIISPVDGIIIDRRVSVGQTVVSNQTASSIFLVARDFKKMQVWVSVNEADVGAIKVGMPVIFSCDAFPNREFRGTVHRLRLNATLSSNVVTYVVEVNADNSDGTLIPYLTANVKFIRAEECNVLTVPANALRFTPPAELQAAPAPEISGRREGVVWIADNSGKARPVKVKVKLTNGITTAIESNELTEGTTIITGIQQVFMNAPQAEGTNNPFMPNMPKRSGRGSAGQRERAAQRAAEAGTPPPAPPQGGAR